MIAIDTNILVRYLIGETENDAEQASKAVSFIDGYFSKNKTIFVNNIIICETIWVLKYHYNVTKSDILKVLNAITKQLLFEFEDKICLICAIKSYEKTPADFADCLISETNKKFKALETYSFDKKAIKHLNFKEI